jgi:D-alanyl-D-alanine carboxypeptidase/D-alanyl-D-alanine-endopeptidase (penicillin-binding protein 4)
VPVIVNDNLIDLVITPGRRGEPAGVEWRPKCSCIQVDPKVVTSESGAKTKIEVRMPSPGRIVVRGSLAEGHAPLVRTQEVDDPVAFARALLIEALARANVACSASPFDPVRDGALPARDVVAGLPEVASFVSPPFAENAKLILKVSHNLHASLLPLLLATRAGKRTLRAGLEEQGKVLAALGVPADSIAFGGGAGGAQVDRTTPRAAVTLLRAIGGEPWGQDFAAMLPSLGVDGTLRLAVEPTSKALGKVNAKTGTYYLDDPLNGNTLLTSKALAGYLQAKSGRRFAFCFVVNGVRLANEAEADRIGQVLGKLCEVAWEEL